MTAQAPVPYGQPQGGGGTPQQQQPQQQDNMEMLQKAISSMEERGMQSDPRYQHLLNIRAKQQGYMQGDGSNPSQESPGGGGMDQHQGGYQGPPMQGGMMGSQASQPMMPSSSMGMMGQQQQQQQQPPMGSPMPGQQMQMGQDAGQMRQTPFLPAQLHQLRAQIMAYKLLARNQPVPENLRMALEGKKPLAPQYRPSMPQQQQQPGMRMAQQMPQQQQPMQGMPGQGLPQGARYPGPGMQQQQPPQQGQPQQQQQVMGPQGMMSQQQQPQQQGQATPKPDMVAPPRPGMRPQMTGDPSASSMQTMMSMQQKQNRLAPINKPQGIDPITALQERENRIAARITSRIAELQNLPAVMPEDVQCKAMIELKALRLLNFQRQVCASCFLVASKTPLTPVIDNSPSLNSTAAQRGGGMHAP